MTIIGGSIVVAFGLLAFLPGVIWSEALLWDCKLRPLLHYQRADGKMELCILKTSRMVGWPFAVFIFLIHACVYLINFASSSLANSMLMVLVAASLSLYFATSMFRGRVIEVTDQWWRTSTAQTMMKQDLRAPERGFSLDDVASSMAKYVVAFVVSAALSLIALLILEHLLSSEQAWRAVLMWLLCASVVVVANLLVAVLFASRRVPAALVSAAFATILLLVTGEYLYGGGSLLHRVMESYGVGEMTRYDVIVKNEGREQLAAQAVQSEICSGGRGRIRDVAILSRLGEEFVMRTRERTVSIPSDEVVSWSKAAAADAGRDLQEAGKSSCRPVPQPSPTRAAVWPEAPPDRAASQP